MSLNTIAFLIIYFLGAALALVKDPIYGLATYIFEYYNHPSLHWWGKSLPDLRWSLLISLVLLIAYLLRSGSCPYSFLKAPPTKWFLLLLITVWLVNTFAAIVPAASSKRATDYSKLILLYFLIIKVIRTPQQYQLIVWMHLISAFRWGWHVFRHPSGGRLEGLGGPDTSGSNELASHLLTVLPFLGYYFLAGQRWEKVACVLIAPFVVNMIILANSRGALLGIAVQGITAIMLSRGVVRSKAILGLVLGAGLFLYLADDNFIERQQTTLHYEEDTSATSRLDFWRAGGQIMQDYPLGLGADGFNAMLEQYLPTQPGRSPHSMYIKVGVEWGICGLLFYLAAFGSVFMMLHRLRRQSQSDNGPMSRAYYEALAIEIGLIGRFTTGIFGNYLYNESFYWLAGLTVSLYNIAHSAESISEAQQEAKSNQFPNRIRTAITQWRIRHQIRKAEKRLR
ncbi:O-antigen ligase family protein [Candidatus Poribacteria bacterium]|nr:O-antigen ligase family protein [Candidatus Poribacteria bacterium]